MENQQTGGEAVMAGERRTVAQPAAEMAMATWHDIMMTLCREHYLATSHIVFLNMLFMRKSELWE